MAIDNNIPTFVERDPAVIMAESKAKLEELLGRELQPAQVEQLILNFVVFRETLLVNRFNAGMRQMLYQFSTAPILDYIAGLVAVALLAALMLSLAFGWGGWPFVVALLLYYIIYFVEAGISWVYNTVRRKLSATAAADTAYYASMFEMEAHANEGDNQYIRGRKSFNWIRYFGKV